MVLANMIDFDTFNRLYVNEPRIADILRKKLIDRQIRKYAKNSIDLWKKRGWWTRVELDMNQYNGVGRMVAASRRMWDSFHEMNDKLNEGKK